MPDVTHTKTYLLINYETSSIYDRENHTNITEELIFKTYQSPVLDGLTADIILPHTRTDLRLEHNSREFYTAVMKLKEYEVKGPWTFESLYDNYLNGFLQQLDWASDNAHCKHCQLTAECAERGIHTLMKISGISDCISPAKALEDVIVWA
jgi:hypothetical protein